jgi:prolipoprotein diacylglyceryltransferase
MIIVLIAGVAMFFGDVAQGVYVILEETRPWLASFFDGLDDWASYFSIGMGGATTVVVAHGTPHLHVTWITPAILAVVMVGSILGGRLGNYMSKRITGKPAVTQSLI